MNISQLELRSEKFDDSNTFRALKYRTSFQFREIELVRQLFVQFFCIKFCESATKGLIASKNSDIDRQVDRQTERQTDRQTDIKDTVSMYGVPFVFCKERPVTCIGTTVRE